MKQNLEQYILEHFQTAIEKRYIQPWYQPVIRTISRKLCSFEALARWNDPEYGLIRPDMFIPVLERTGQIHMLDICIIRQVCERLRRSMDRGEIPIPVSVNLSRKDFQLCDIFSVVDDLARQYRIPHEFLYIEITESTMAQQEELMHRIVDQFHLAGYQVWMDDFGSGYSSLNTLKDFTFDELKLDMHFLSSFTMRSRRILTALVQMAKDIDIHTLAEGVETEEQFRYLRNIGCEKVQGYFFGRPMPYDEVLKHLAATGIPIEPPQERKYYDDIGRMNLLSAVPMMSREERDVLTTARQLNSIPLALMELDAAHFSFLFHNSAFEEIARGIGLPKQLFRREQLGVPQPSALLDRQMRHLFDATRSGETGRLLFINHDEYYEVRAKCVSQMKDRYCVLLQMQNLSRASGAQETGHLDESLRQIYSLFERITLINVEEDVIEPLFVDTHTDLVSSRHGLRERVKEYAAKLIFPEDQPDFEALMNQDTIEERLIRARQPYVSACLRSLVGHGQYAWKQYTVLRLQEGNYLLLIRNVHDAARHFLSCHCGDTIAPGHLRTAHEDMVWKSLLQSGIIRLFWKDRERRFLGASQAFLDYYDFRSLDDIRGKNDEDLGWHIHADAYKSDEYQVIQEGAVVKNMPGHCIRNGENRDILANKAPLYDENGEIQGLVGYFIDRDLLNVNDTRGTDTKRRDLMTGLLNSRGLMEEEASFRDEYELRNIDFVRIHITIDDFATLVKQHGIEFGDKAMVALGRLLKREFGQTSAVARYSGQRFVILRQISNPEEAKQLRQRIKSVASSLQNIDGVPLTLYLSVGYALYSDGEDLSEQQKRAENSLLVDYDDNASVESRISNATEIFHLYDDLPIPFAVFKVVTNDEGVVRDALLFYANKIYQRNSGKPMEELLGHSTRTLFPTMNEMWYDAAARAALNGESVQELFYFEPAKSYYHITASQVIHPGYCGFTFLAFNTNGKLVNTDLETQMGAGQSAGKAP